MEPFGTQWQSLISSPGMVKDGRNFILAKEFYFVLASTLDLQFGKILLATSTKSQIQEVIDKDWPFFTNNTDLVKKCLSDNKCDSIQDIVKKIGMLVFFGILMRADLKKRFK